MKRHLGVNNSDIELMLQEMKINSLDELIKKVIPKNIYSPLSANLFEKNLSEDEVLDKLKIYANKNSSFKSFIGMGYNGTIIPNVIKRNVFENPGWYTQYTPYQAEISQGRLEALLNFQTLISSSTGLPIANASLLDEGTAASEAMTMFFNATKSKIKNKFFISKYCHPQTIDILKTRSEPLNIDLIIEDEINFNFDESIFGLLLQYPTTDGKLFDYSKIINRARDLEIFTCLATDILALSVIKTPGEMGADAAVGNAQRFGVPLGYGGPHAAFFATTEKFKRKIPGRIIGVSNDVHGRRALRMALQTREQHIRREKATSNICTSQVLLAIMSSMYAIYHGPKNIKNIAYRVNRLCSQLAVSLSNAGIKLYHKEFFDTIRFFPKNDWKALAQKEKFNFRIYEDGSVGISIDEETKELDILKICKIFQIEKDKSNLAFPKQFNRGTDYLAHGIFNSYHSETEMLRYIHKLEVKDLSLNTSMIPLGSCTMKLNATSEMVPVTWPKFSNIHPFAPLDQAQGYMQVFDDLINWLSVLTGFDDCSLQPNSGAQGEYTGLLVIRAYHINQGEKHRNICLVPESAHGTNPASAIMAGMEVKIILCDQDGNIDLQDLKNKADLYSKNLSSIMLTYPSTHGIFENKIQEACEIVHNHGGQVYIDGANLNAMVGLCKPGEFGGDVMHINLHKTFCIPHGGGGPGMGPIVCKEHLSKFLPTHFHSDKINKNAINPVSAAPYGSGSILLISWAYIAMLNTKGLTKATKIAILNANYMAEKLSPHFDILFRKEDGYNAHEFIIDIRPIKKEYGISEEDVAKRLMDYGYHAPTMSWPVPGTMMIEPTESESKNELDTFCNALISIKKEIIDSCKTIDTPLKNAPHTALHIASENWGYSYSREVAAFPTRHQKEHKYWPTVGRIDNAYGDRNLVCTCPSVDEYK
ncbi:MAG: aminomethyl-transferring glycine dehydrogenase [Candidatus Neomarinimicrobiota bacterium]